MILTIKETAEYLSVSPGTVHQFIAAGKLRAARMSVTWRSRPDAGIRIDDRDLQYLVYSEPRFSSLLNS